MDSENFDLEGLRPEQKSQISRQVKSYEEQKQTELVAVKFLGLKLELEVDPLVANPNIMNSGIQVVKFLEKNPGLVAGKIITDMGTGSGVIGIAAGIGRAKHVFMPDIEKRAVDNAGRNIKRLKLAGICEVLQSDLFNNFGGKPKAEVQIFNQPFFSANPVKGKKWTRIMLGGTDLIARYLKEAPKYSTNDAIYIMPWLTLAENLSTTDNNPGKRAPKFGFEIENIIEQDAVNQGIQQAKFKIFILRHKGAKKP